MKNIHNIPLSKSGRLAGLLYRRLLFALGLLTLGSPASNGWAIADPPGGALTGPRYRVIVSTDIGGSDFDDDQSMVHLLQYADIFDIEGLISSPPGAGRKSDIEEVIDKYQQDYSKLVTYSSNYPLHTDLRNITKQGAINGAPSQGWSTTGTDGSDLIISRALASDPRPLYVLVWGSLTDVAQAVHEEPSIKSKIRVICTAGSTGFNHTGDPAAWNYLNNSHPDLWMVNQDSTFRGMYVASWNTTQYGNGPFTDTHCAGHGALGDYMESLNANVKAGDTPLVLYLMRGNPDDPTTEHWGGRFYRPSPSTKPNYWTDITDPDWALMEGPNIRYGARTVSQYHDNFMAHWATRMDRSQMENPDGNPPPGIYEAESLARADSGAGTTLVSDTNASGGALTKLNSTAASQWVEFTIPNVAAGTYSVKVLDKTYYSRGTYQLSSGGTNVGSPVDQYGGGSYREVVLGDVTFTSAGNKTFRFTVTGKNSGSTGYDLVIDAIVLTSQGTPPPAGETNEAEDLTSTHSGQGSTLIADASSSGGEWIRFDAVATGNWIEFTVPGVTAGTYTVKVLDKTHTSRGTYQLSSGGASIGSPVDQYGGATYREITLGDVTFGSTGSKTFRFTVAGKHAGSSGYNLSIDAIVLIPQASYGGVSEAEDLGATHSGQGSTLIADTGASGSEWIKFDAVATGNWIEFTVPSVAAGSYTVKVLDKTHTSRGTYQLSSGGTNIGSSVDQYGGASYREVTVGNVTFSSTGNKAFRFTVAGKHVGSSGYNLSIDAIILEPQ